MFTQPLTTDSVPVPNHRLTKKRDVVAYKNRAFSAVKKPCGGSAYCRYFKLCTFDFQNNCFKSRERKFSIYARKILNLLQKNSQSLIFYSMHLGFLLNRVSNSLSRHKGTTFFAYVQKKSASFLGTCTFLGRYEITLISYNVITIISLLHPWR